MAILINQDTRLLVQGCTGRAGLFHCHKMVAYGTCVVAGVTPGRGGQRVCDGVVPVFDTVEAAVTETGANVSILYVPARFAAEAILEAADAGIPLIVCITEGIPVQDMIRVSARLAQTQARLIGPNCPGVISPGKCNVGIIPGHVAMPGPVGIVSRSGTLTYEVINALTARGIGQSTCVGIGGDPVIGTSFVEVLEMFEADPETEQVVLIGEIGGNAEQQAAQFIAERMSKPVVALVAGRTAPPGKRMGHAGAIVERDGGTATAKIAAFEAIGGRVAEYPEQVPDLVM
ncbi:MAG: succinate--CoA ligase subunit alpha [Anaerolineae bacterium]|nr:succinate--CoA ligase subunit alpha [Anaerolineae bacterium]